MCQLSWSTLPPWDDPPRPSSFRLPEVQHLISLGASLHLIHQCAFGTPWKKPTGLLSTTPALTKSFLRRLPREGQCIGGHTHQPLGGIGAMGEFSTAQAKTYPSALNRFFAQVFHAFASDFLSTLPLPSTPDVFTLIPASALKFFVPLDPYWDFTRQQDYMLSVQVVTHSQAMMHNCSHFQLSFPCELPVFSPPDEPSGARIQFFRMPPSSAPWDSHWCSKTQTYVTTPPADGKAASSRDGWQAESYGAPPPPPSVPPPGTEPQAVTLQSVPVTGALAGYSFKATAIDMLQAAEVGRPLLPIPVPDEEHEGELPPQPNFSTPVQDHTFIEPTYQILPYNDGSYAYIPVYHARAQPGAAGTSFSTMFIDPSVLPLWTLKRPLSASKTTITSAFTMPGIPQSGSENLAGWAITPWYPWIAHTTKAPSSLHSTLQLQYGNTHRSYCRWVCVGRGKNIPSGNNFFTSFSMEMMNSTLHLLRHQSQEP